MGSLSPPIPPSGLTKLPTEKIYFTPFNEDWNVYKIPESGLKLKIKLVVSSVSKVRGAFDQFGYPIYTVQSTNAIIPVHLKIKK